MAPATKPQTGSKRTLLIEHADPKVAALHRYRKGSDIANKGTKAKKDALADMLALPGVEHGTKVTDPFDSTVWTVVNEATMTDPKVTAWDALLRSDILTKEQVKQATALHKQLSKPSTRQNITKV